MKRFEKKDGFRQKFRRCRPEVGETFLQFSVRLSSYLDRWVELGKVNNTYEGLFYMMLRDQFLSICSRDPLLFLKERIPKDIQEMSVLADQYREARHAYIQTLDSSSKRETFGDKNSTSKDRDKREQTTGGNAPTTKPPMRRDGRCYKCNRPSHISSQCPQRYRNSVGAAMGIKTRKKRVLINIRTSKASVALLLLLQTLLHIRWRQIQQIL